MSLEINVKNIVNNFDEVSSDEFLEILNQIMLEFKSNLTVEYLKGKIQKIVEISSESEKKKQCKSLLPYYDWYLQGQ
ncbi:MAG: hypothetical protein EA437_06530 [Candidatus Nitrosomarinus sp.]|nr:MAG: hypothetical protein EA437_06530 [Candidatus Nitrosomarinus sp.]